MDTTLLGTSLMVPTDTALLPLDTNGRDNNNVPILPDVPWYRPTDVGVELRLSTTTSDDKLLEFNENTPTPDPVVVTGGTSELPARETLKLATLGKANLFVERSRTAITTMITTTTMIRIAHPVAFILNKSRIFFLKLINIVYY